ncbi:MAG: SpoIIE family protein phosphatase [Acidobacteriaceae bacterium]
MAVSSSLPLGLDAGSAYPETPFQLSVKARLTLMTDGVAEARNRGGELFGFDRTASIATSPAGSIALAAQQFGQQDDITVLTVAMEPVAEATGVRVAPPDLMPA